MCHILEKAAFNQLRPHEEGTISPPILHTSIAKPIILPPTNITKLFFNISKLHICFQWQSDEATYMW